MASKREVSFPHVFSLRMSDAERAQLGANAKALGVTPSKYMRLLVSLPTVVAQDRADDLDAFGTEGACHVFLVYDKATLRQLVKQLRAWGYHYNQAVHALNIITYDDYMSPEDTLDYVGRAMELLSDIDMYRSSIDELLRSALRNPAFQV